VAAALTFALHLAIWFTPAWRLSMPVESVVEHQRIWIDGLNRGDVSAADVAFAPDCVVHITGVAEPFRGVGPWKELMAGFLLAFPDLHFTIEDQLVQGNHVAFRWSATGTHTGPLGAAPPTGKPVALDGLIIDRVAGGRVQERWEQWDQSLMLQQLGFA
jgi:predicted ester cyclase